MARELCEVVSFANPKSVSLRRALGLLEVYKRFSGCRVDFQSYSVKKTMKAKSFYINFIDIGHKIITLTSRCAMFIACKY